MEPNAKKNVQRTLYYKIGFILVLILLLMIPNVMIQDLILERQTLDQQVKREISENWGPNQKIVGPILSIPYETEIVKDDKSTIISNTLRIVPEYVDINGKIIPEQRKKGIYKAIIYNASHTIKGSFKIPQSIQFGKNVKEIFWDKASLDFGFTSAASLNDIVHIKWSGDVYKMESGVSYPSLFESGIHAQVNINPTRNDYEFSTTIGINGSESIQYLPVADHTEISVNSTWDAPGFMGLPAPVYRDIDKEGFTAVWKATEYNRPFKKTWKNNEINVDLNAALFGVNLVQTVSHYHKNMRSAKYALLIISLSFLVFFFFEILKGNKIHPIQYIFIGMTLSVFYILLLSISEHFGFDTAYIIASVSTVALISWYSKYLLKQSGSTFTLTTLLSILYAYIFCLLQLEDLALLVGSLGLFFALAITMYLSRNTNWYNMTSNKVSPISTEDLDFQ
ncbi:MAG: cell envelope integrity protein CreD [Saprospiraceae bacterium]|nr:cell envelope integrity protein CreD [Saprospiraceae bacterium]